MSMDTFFLALGLAFVGFAILVILTVMSARYSPEAEERRELERLANRLARMSAREEDIQRRRAGRMTLEQEALFEQRKQAAFDDGT
jgi:membrane protein implicated in regulation of membrane protease activity